MLHSLRRFRPAAGRGHLLCLLLATGVLACAGTYNGPASGTWVALTQMEQCEGCETRVALDLRENAQGLVTGVAGTESRNAIERLAGAAWVTGWRVGDSLHLTFLPPCPSDEPLQQTQGFRGRLWPTGQLLGVLWGRDRGTLSYNLSVTLQRGSVDSLVLETFEDLRKGECEPR